MRSSAGSLRPPYRLPPPLHPSRFSIAAIARRLRPGQRHPLTLSSHPASPADGSSCDWGRSVAVNQITVLPAGLFDKFTALTKL